MSNTAAHLDGATPVAVAQVKPKFARASVRESERVQTMQSPMKVCRCSSVGVQIK